MKAHILKGSKQEIVDRLIRIRGEVCEAIVFEDEPPATTATPHAIEDVFAEMAPFMIDAAPVDDAREAVYTRMDAE